MNDPMDTPAHQPEPEPEPEPEPDAHDPAHAAAEAAARAAVLQQIADAGSPRRARLMPAAAVLTAALALPALVGVVLVAADPRDDGAVSDPRAAAGVPTAGAAGSTDGAEAPVPLRIEDADVTMEAAPTPRRQRPRAELAPGPVMDRDLAGSREESARTAYDSVPLPVYPTPVSRARVPVDPSYPGNLQQVEDLLAKQDAGQGAGQDAGQGAQKHAQEQGPVGSLSGEGASFVVSTFNVLGSSHTVNGRRGRKSGPQRMYGAVELLRRNDVDVAGFQELQNNQVRALRRITKGAWGLYPGLEGPGRDSDNSIGWRTSEFEMVKGELIPIPYFNGGRRRMPVVLLRHKASGVKAWFANFHNPAETRRYRNQGRWRVKATYLEAALVNRLAPSGLPVFVTGDMNERKAFFCRFTGAAPSMTAARGGTNGPGGCRPGRPRVIDWIFGSRGVKWTGYREDRSRLVEVTTDHPVISVRAFIDTGVFPRSAAD